MIKIVRPHSFARRYQRPEATGPTGYPDMFGLGSSGPDVAQDLSHLGFAHVQVSNATSATVAAELVSDIKDAQGNSVLGRTIDPPTPLIAVTSSGR